MGEREEGHDWFLKTIIIALKRCVEGRRRRRSNGEEIIDDWYDDGVISSTSDLDFRFFLGNLPIKIITII